MAALQIIERDIIIATLLANPTIVDLVGNRVIWEFVARKGNVDYPYIRVNLKYGGYENITNRRATKSTWQITGLVDNNLQIAEQLLNAIHDTFHSKHPTIPETYDDEVEAVYTVLEEQSIFRAFKYHNEPVFDVGGLYCLRMTLCEVTD